MPINAQPTRGPKLRHSCDACNIAKVKCSKARPACARCHSHQLQCIYGVSMRSGKHPASRNKVPKHLPVSQRSRITSHQGAVFEGSAISILAEKSVFFEHTAPSLVEPIPLHDNRPNILPDINGLYNLESLMSVDGQSHQSYSESYGGDMFEGDQSHPFWSNTQSIPQNVFSTEQPPPIPLFTPITPEAPSAILSRTVQRQSKAAALSSCFCNQKILQQLFELSRGFSVPPSFDVALHQNKKVVTLCQNILNDHTCSQHDAPYVLAFAALIARIISVYESIYLKHYQSAPSSESSMRSRSNTWSGDDGASIFASEMDDSESLCSSANPSNFKTHWTTPYPFTISLPSMDTGRIATKPLPLTLDAHRLGHEDEESLKMNILKIELSKVGDLVKAFGQRYAGNSSKMQYEAKVNEDMVSFLQKRLRDSRDMLSGQER